MFESLNGVDWDLLYRQKLTLLQLRQRQPEGSVEADALSGVIHLLDALQDNAAASGRWVFPGESPAPKRYYVEDDEGQPAASRQTSSSSFPNVNFQESSSEALPQEWHAQRMRRAISGTNRRCNHGMETN